MARQMHHCGFNVDPPHHRTEHAGTGPSIVLPKKDFRSLPATVHKGRIWWCIKWKARLQGSLHLGWHGVPSLLSYSWKARQKEPSHATHRIHCRPHKKVCGGNENELNKLPRQ
jgi:hypothetical protein